MLHLFFQLFMDNVFWDMLIKLGIIYLDERLIYFKNLSMLLM